MPTRTRSEFIVNVASRRTFGFADVPGDQFVGRPANGTAIHLCG
jgi:hypothetical protein